MGAQELRVLLADDDQDDYLITRDLLLGIESERFRLDWVPTYHAALEAIELNNHDLYLFDYHLGEGDGLDLLSKAVARGCKAPIILLTGLDDWETDTRAIKAGAADYLVKGQLDSRHLERSIRHAMERKRAKEELGEYSTETEVRVHRCTHRARQPPEGRGCHPGSDRRDSSAQPAGLRHERLQSNQ